ncbi:MAG TPA: putative LPS assembly protein LptD, partial [bacterium]|nr:putative LPS assembly protein LptD [bacterium]
NAWFSQSEVDSVTVQGNGSGEYRMGPGPEEKTVTGMTPEQMLEKGRLVRYRAPRIRYLHKEEKMHLDQGSEVEYKTMILKAGTIEFDSKKEVLDASGDPPPTLVDKKDEISGEEMRYHLGQETGEILLGRTRFENGYYSGQEVWRLNHDILAIHHAAFTTCDLATPHYHFTSQRMKIYPNDKIVAKPVVLRIRDIPVLALPFYTASLKRDRHSGFLIPNLELGVDDERGRFIRKVGYYWVPNDYTDFTTSFDFYPEQERFVGYLSSRYALRYKFNGRAEIKYNRDVPANSKDTAFEFDHRQTFSDTMELTASGSFLSSSSIYRDIDDSRRLDRDIRSHATLNKRFTNSNQSLRAELERRENLDTGQINETLPIIQYSLPSRTVGGKESNLYYGSDARFVHVRDRIPLSTGGFSEDEPTGARVGADLRSTVSLQPYTRITPSVTAEGVWQNEDREGDPNAFRGTFSTNVGATSTLYGTFLKKMGPVTGIRHVFEPSASWQWAPEFEKYFFTDSTGTRRDRFFSFGGIGGTPPKTNRGSISIRNLIQSKLLRDGKEQRYDVFTFRHSLSYDFLASDFGRKPWSNLTSSLNVLSSLPVNQTWSVIHDVYDGDVVNTSVTTQMRVDSSMFHRDKTSGGEASIDFANPPADFEKPPTDSLETPHPVGVLGGTAGSWTLDASHSFQRGGPDNYSSWLVIGTSWIPTPKWRVTFNTQYDLKTGENTAQEWAVHRAIHCWEFSFDRRLLGGEWQYYFRINVTQLPDIQAEHGDRIRGRSGLPGFDTLGGY